MIIDKIIIFFILLGITQNINELKLIDLPECRQLLYNTLESFSPGKEIYIYKINQINNGLILDIYDEYLNNYELFFDYTLKDCANYYNMELSEIIKRHKFILKRKNCKELNSNLSINEEKYNDKKNNKMRQIQDEPIHCTISDITLPDISLLFPTEKNKINPKYLIDFPFRFFINWCYNPETGKIDFIEPITDIELEENVKSSQPLPRKLFIYLIQIAKAHKIKIKFKNNKHKNESICLQQIWVVKKI